LQGTTDAAASHFLRVLSAPDHTHRQQAWLGTGRCHFAAGDLAGARRLFEQALELGGPLTAEISLWLGRTALSMGDAAEAMVTLRPALKLATGSISTELAAVLNAALERIAPSWEELPERVEEPEGIIDLLQALLDYLGKDARLSDFLAPTQRLHTAMNAPLSLAIVGEFNAGKSTIVNALVGDEVFPTGVLPTTAHTGIVRWGPRKAARVIYVDDEREEQSLAEARTTMKTNADRVARVEFTHPHPALRLVHYWDTPGFNALEDRHETTAADALQRAEAILWVMDANQVLSQTEFERIEQLPSSAERLVVVINKIDRLGPLDDRGDDVGHLLDYVQDNLEGRTAGVFAISARDATSEDEAVRDASGFEDFMTFLDERVVQRAGRIKTVEVTRQLSSLVFTLEAFQNGLVARYGALAADVTEVHDWLAEAEKETGPGHAKEEVETVAAWLDRMLVGVEEEIDDAMRPTSGWTGKRALAEEEREFVLSLMLQRLDRVAEASSERVEQQIAAVERQIAERLDPVLRALTLGDARALQRRLDGFYDESRVVRLLWQERVYGALREWARARIDADGQRVLDSIVAAQADQSMWRAHLRRLVPTVDDAFGKRIEHWYAAFFEAASRLCDRVRNDLELLELEAKTRYDVAAVRALIPLDTEVETPADGADEVRDTE
jgi:small GTP-binding protein